MNKNDEKLKAMWNKAETLMEASDYKSSSIEQFISGRSNDTTQKIKNIIINISFFYQIRLLCYCSCNLHDFFIYF